MNDRGNDKVKQFKTKELVEKENNIREIKKSLLKNIDTEQKEEIEFLLKRL